MGSDRHQEEQQAAINNYWQVLRERDQWQRKAEQLETENEALKKENIALKLKSSTAFGWGR